MSDRSQTAVVAADVTALGPAGWHSSECRLTGFYFDPGFQARMHLRLLISAGDENLSRGMVVWGMTSMTV